MRIWTRLVLEPLADTMRFARDIIFGFLSQMLRSLEVWNHKQICCDLHPKCCCSQVFANAPTSWDCELPTHAAICMLHHGEPIIITDFWKMTSADVCSWWFSLSTRQRQQTNSHKHVRAMSTFCFTVPETKIWLGVGQDLSLLQSVHRYNPFWRCPHAVLMYCCNMMLQL